MIKASKICSVPNTINPRMSDETSFFFLLPGHSQIVPVSVVIQKSVVSSRLRITP
jgi:hypothetical protein